MMVNKIASRRRFCSREALAQSWWGGKSLLGETGIVLPTPVAFFAIKRVQVLTKMSKTGDTDYTCVPFVAILDTGVRLYCVFPD
jgi:hypothetical protein